MKIQSILMSVVMLFLATTQINAQKNLAAADISYTMKAVSEDASTQAQMDMVFADAKMRITFDKKYMKVENKMGMMSHTISLTDNKSGKITILTDMPMAGIKTVVETTKEEMAENAPDEELEWDLSSDVTKEILGHTCKVAIAKGAAQGNLKIYYTKDIELSHKVAMMGIQNTPFKGIPMRMELSNGSFDMEITAEKFSKEVSAKAFELDTEDYEEMDLEEFQESMKGMGGGR